MMHFVNIGTSTYGLVNEDEELAGVLYYTQCEEAEDEEKYYWYWVDSKSPEQHEGLKTPSLCRDFTQEQIEANTKLAMETLQNLLEAAQV